MKLPGSLLVPLLLIASTRAATKTHSIVLGKSVAIKLMDGQTVHGWIEYYDKNMVRLTREGAPNLFIFKHEIMYITEDGGKRK